jgi:hypothetical protein
MIRLSGSSEINEGFEAVWRADFDRAVALLHNVDAPGCSTMRSRVYLRMNLPKRAVAEYERASHLRLHPRERAEMTLIGSGAYRAIGDAARADALWHEAERLGGELDDPLFDLIRICVSTVRDFTDGRLADSLATAKRGMALCERSGNRESPFTYLFEGNHLRARFLEVLAMHAALAGDHREHERLLIDAVLTGALVRRRDVFTEVHLLASLATYLTTYPAPRARELVHSRAKAIAWNDHLDYKRSYIKRGLRSNKDIFGSPEDVESFGGRGFPTLAWRVSDSVDRLLGSNWADRSAFDTELGFAMELAERVDWQETPGEEIASLPLLCALVAPRAVDVAEKLMAAYREKLKSLSGQFLYVWEGRRPALERFAEASIAKARGDFPLALEKYAQSQAYWTAREMRARAAFTGLERYTMSREAADLAPAVEFLNAFPTSAFARRLGSAFQRSASARPGEFLFLYQGTGA